VRGRCQCRHSRSAHRQGFGRCLVTNCACMFAPPAEQQRAADPAPRGRATVDASGFLVGQVSSGVRTFKLVKSTNQKPLIPWCAWRSKDGQGDRSRRARTPYLHHLRVLRERAMGCAPEDAQLLHHLLKTQGWSQAEDRGIPARREEPSVEGWRFRQQGRRVYFREDRTRRPTSSDGETQWLCRSAPSCDGQKSRTTARSFRTGASHQRKERRQPDRESRTLEAPPAGGSSTVRLPLSRLSVLGDDSQC
jgi:hypothetical protein